MDELTFQPIFSTAAMAIIAGLAVLILWLGPSLGKLSVRKKVTLTLLRLGVVLLAFLAMLRPGCIQKTEQNQSAVLMVLSDISRSMDLPHVQDDSTRWNTVKEMLADNQPRFKQLAEKKIEVKFFQFDSELAAMDTVDGKVVVPDKPTGSETDIGSPILDAVLSVRDRRLLALVLASDGVQNVLDPAIEMADAVDGLVDLEAPLIGVQLGTAGDSGQVADVAITSFAEQMVVNKKSDLNAQATLVARGYAGQDIKVELLINDGATEEIVATQWVQPAAALEEINVNLTYRPEQPGEYRISVRAASMPGELAVRNNSLDGFLTVRDKGMRVLMLSGPLGWEQRALRDSLPALDFIDLSFVPIFTPPADVRSRKWPLEFLNDEFSAPDRYDVFILCNVDARSLWDARKQAGPLQALADTVKSGKGLLMIGGTHSFGAGGYAGTPLADVLPIEMKKNEIQPFDSDIRTELHINRPIQPTPVFDSFMTRISDTDSNREVWKKLPPLVGANRLTVKQSPTIEIQLQSSDQARHPILVAADVGGRVLAFAGDSTWRWRLAGFKKEFDQFWRQIVLWLAFWDAKTDQSLTIDLPKRRFPPNAKVRFGVGVRTTTGEYVSGVEFDAQIRLPDGSMQKIQIVPNGNSYRCDLPRELLAQSGVHRIFVQGSKDGQPVGRGEREFVVLDRDKEKANPAANPQQLARLAKQTAEFGGKVIAPDELAGLLDQYIENPPIKKIEIPTSWRIGETMYDGSLFLLVFVGLLAVEWGLRKHWGLV